MTRNSNHLSNVGTASCRRMPTSATDATSVIPKPKEGSDDLPNSTERTQTLVRAVLGLLLAANLVAAIIAFHLIGESPADLDAQLTTPRRFPRRATDLNQTKSLARNMDLSREQAIYFCPPT